MRLTEAEIRGIVRGVIRESLNDRKPVFPPGSRERLEVVLKRLEPIIRKEISESDLPSVKRYVEMTMDPDLPNEIETGEQLDRSADEAMLELAENPTSAIKTAAALIVNLVWSKWLEGQGADEADAGELEYSDPMKTMIIHIVGRFKPEAAGWETNINQTVERWIESLPEIWTNQVFMAKMEAGKTMSDALA